MKQQSHTINLYPRDRDYLIDALTILQQQKRKLVDSNYQSTQMNEYWDEWAQVTNLLEYLKLHLAD